MRFNVLPDVSFYQARLDPDIDRSLLTPTWTGWDLSEEVSNELNTLCLGRWDVMVSSKIAVVTFDTEMDFIHFKLRYQ